MNNDLFFSSKTDEWSTPQEFYQLLNKEFYFTLDPCANEFNHKCDKYYTKEQNGLNQSWSGERVFCNPPYGRSIKDWIEKCHKESKEALIVLLIPARTDTQYFHKYIYNKPNVEVRFLKGRLKFGGGKNAAPFPSMLVIWRNNE